jgi:hypothetical protein
MSLAPYRCWEGLPHGKPAEQLVGGRQLGVAASDQLRASLPEGVGVEPGRLGHGRPRGGRAQARDRVEAERHPVDVQLRGPAVGVAKTKS